MEKELNVDVKSLWQRLIDLIIKTIISGEHTINQLSAANLGSRYNAYELFGIDVLFDTELKPWLLEVRVYIAAPVFGFEKKSIEFVYSRSTYLHRFIRLLRWI